MFLFQNQHLSSAQKFVISFVYNHIWKRISNSFVDLITPSIVKSNQLIKITDYRNHNGFCEGIELLLKTRGETHFKGKSTSHLTKRTENVIECNVLSENRFLNCTTNEESCKIDKKCQFKSNTSNGLRVNGFQVNESHKKNANLDLSPNKETMISFQGHIKKCSQINVNSECDGDKDLKNTIDCKKNDLTPSVLCLKTNNSGSNDIQRNSCKTVNPPDSNSTLQNAGDILDKERLAGAIQDKTSKIKYTKNINKYHSNKTSNDLPKIPKSYQGMDTNSPLKKTCPTDINKKGNKSSKSRSTVDRQRKSKDVKDKLVIEDNCSLKAGSSLKFKTNRKNDGITKHDQIDPQVSLLDQKEYFKNISKTDLKQENIPENGCTFIKEVKQSKYMTKSQYEIETKQESGSEIDVLDESCDKSMLKTYKNANEVSSISKIMNKTSSLQMKLIKINKAIKSKPSKSKYKKRKARIEKKLKKLILLTQATTEIQPNNIKEKMTTNKNKVGSSSAEECKLQNINSIVTESYNRKSDILPKHLNDKEKPISNSGKEANQNSKRITNETNKTPENVKNNNLVVFDTTQEEGRFLVHEQRFGKTLKSNLINLNTVITEESSPKKSHSKTKNSTINIDSKIKLKKSDSENLKPVTITPWKRNKDMLAESRNKTKNESKISNKHLDSGTSTANASFTIPDVSSHNKTNKKPLMKTFSLSGVHSQNKKESLSPKKTASVESSTLKVKVSLATKSEIPHIKDNNSSNNYYQNETQTTLKNKDIQNYSKEEQQIRHRPTEQFYRKTLVDSKTAAVCDEKKMGAASGNELNSKSGKVIGAKQNLDVAQNQLKEKPNDSLNSTKHLEYQNVVNRTVPKKTVSLPLKESNENIISSLKQPHATHSIVGTNSKRENKSDKQTQFQGSVPPVGSSKPIKSNLEKNTAVISSNTGSESAISAQHADKNKVKDMSSFQNAVSLKKSSQSTNKTRLEYDDVLLAKTVSDISEGLSKILGKEEFKLKMNQLLHGFSVTGQKQQANSIQRQVKSQGVVKTKNEKEKKSINVTSQESDIAVKSVNIKELNVKLKSHEPSSQKSILAKDKTSGKNATKTNNAPGNTGVKENIVFGKPHSKPLTVSVRPALSVPKDTKSRENMTRSAGKNVQRQAAAKTRNTTTITSAPKVKTVISNKRPSSE